MIRINNQARLTLVLLHATTLETLVQQSDSQTHVNTHTLLIDHSCDAVLNENIGTVCAKLVAAIRHLQVKSALHSTSKQDLFEVKVHTLEMTLLYHFLCAWLLVTNPAITRLLTALQSLLAHVAMWVMMSASVVLLPLVSRGWWQMGHS